MAKPLDELGSVPWDRLHHCYGPASDVPEILRGLTSNDEDTVGDAWDGLWGSLFHQGNIFEATAAAIPFLVDLVDSGAVKDKTDLAIYVGSVASAAWRPGQENTPESTQIRAALQSELAVLTRWLVERSSTKRRVATHLIGCSGEVSGPALDSLWGALGRTRSAKLRDQLLLVLRWLHQRSGREATADLAQRIGEFLPSAGAAFFLFDLSKSLPLDRQMTEAVDLALLQSLLDLDDYMDPNLYGTVAPRPPPVTDVWMHPPHDEAKVLFAGPNLTVLHLPNGGRRLARISHPDLRVGRAVQFRVWRDPGPWTLLCETDAGTQAMLFDETGEVALESRMNTRRPP